MIPTNTPVRPRGAGAVPLAVAASAGRQTAYPTSARLCCACDRTALLRGEGGEGREGQGGFHFYRWTLAGLSVAHSLLQSATPVRVEMF